MLRYSRGGAAADASTSLRPHHQRWISEPSTTSRCAGVTGAVQTFSKTSAQQHVKVPAAAAAPAVRPQAGVCRTNAVLPGRYQKKNSSSTLDRGATSKSNTLTSTLQQLGDWARRSFRGHGGGKSAVGRRPKSLNDYVMTEVSSGVIVERQRKSTEKVVASRDPSPVTTSSGYASGGDGTYPPRQQEDIGDFEDCNGGSRLRQNNVERGAWGRGSRRYRRRASVHDAAARPPPTPFDHAPRGPPSDVSALTGADEIQLPVYENLLSKAALKFGEDLMPPVPSKQCVHASRPTRRPDSVQIDSEVNNNTQLKPFPATETGNISINEYLLPTERSSAGNGSSKSSTLRRSANKPDDAVYVNGNLLMTSMNRSHDRRGHDEWVRRSRSLSSPRNRTFTQSSSSTSFDLAGVQQRLTFSPSFVTSPGEDVADWDDRLSTLSLGCRRPRVSPNHQRPNGSHQRRSKSARRRLVFSGGSQPATSVIDRRLEAVEECVRPLFRQTGPRPTISNVAAAPSAARRSTTGLFPRLTADNLQESVYETINDVMERSKHIPVIRGASGGGFNRRVAPDVDTEHVYDNIDDCLVLPSATTTDIHQIPPPLPPPPLPARRPVPAASTSEVPPTLCRSDVVELDSNHVYTIADVLESFEALAAYLPQAQRFIHDLQAAAYLEERRRGGQDAAAGAGKRWTASAAAAASQGLSSRGTSDSEKNPAWLNDGPLRRRAMYAATDDTRPIIAEDYVCSPGNFLDTDNQRQPSRGPTTDAANSINLSDELYVPMKPGGGTKPPASTIFCCGARGSGTLDTRSQNTFVSAALPPDAERRSKQTTKGRTDKGTGSRVSKSITELDRRGNVGNRRGSNVVALEDRRTTPKQFQMQPQAASFIDASSYMLANGSTQLQCDDVARRHKALSRSLMDGISYQPTRPPSGVNNVVDRKQNSRMTTSAFGMAAGRRFTLLETTSDDLTASRMPPRSASEDRQTGSGNSSATSRSPVVVDDGRRPSDRSSHRGSLGLSRSLMVAEQSTVSQHLSCSSGHHQPVSLSTSFREGPTQTDRRQSSILQWTAASCSGREIFC